LLTSFILLNCPFPCALREPPDADERSNRHYQKDCRRDYKLAKPITLTKQQSQSLCGAAHQLNYGNDDDRNTCDRRNDRKHCLNDQTADRRPQHILASFNIQFCVFG
jgi:hypothetical protein